MSKYKTNTLFLIESAIERFQQGGYVNGDYVQLNKSITSTPFFKNLPAQTQEHIQKCIDTDLKLRVSSVKSIRPAIQQVDGGMNAAGDFVVDVVIEYAPGLYKNPISLPVQYVELQATGTEGFGTLSAPDSVVYKNNVHGPEEIDKQSLPTSDTKIPYGNKYMDTPGGLPVGEYNKDHKANTRISENTLEGVYSDIVEKKAKPDYLDVDGDGDKKEPMKKALKNKKASNKKKKSKKKISEEVELQSVYSYGVVNEQPDNLTPDQETTVNKLLTQGFRINKVSHQNAEQDGGPTVYMSKKSGASHTMGEVSPDGMVNDQPIDAFLGDIEDEESLANNQDVTEKPSWQTKLRSAFEQGTGRTGEYVLHQKPDAI